MRKEELFMILLTIYTPTYNRVSTLERVYDSLVLQTNKQFIWQIVDDGSNDNTKEVVEQWMQKDNGFEIRYIYKENGGVHTARNLAHQICDTELIASVDSDDWILKDAVEKLLQAWEENDGSRKKYAGIIAKNIRPDGQNVLTNFPSNVSETTLQKFVYKHKCRGDKFTVVRTELMKKLKPAPVFAGEKLVGEDYFWIQISTEMPFIILNENIGVIDYMPDGYSFYAYRNLFNNPNGFKAYYRQIIISSAYRITKFKGLIGYISCSILLKDKDFIKLSPNKWETIVLFPAGLIWYLYINIRRNVKDRVLKRIC